MNQDRHNEPYEPYQSNGGIQGNDPRYRQSPPQYGMGQSPYEWSFDAMHQSSGRAPSKNRGLKVFLATACTIAMIVVVGFAAYGVYGLVNGNSIGAVQGESSSNQTGNSMPHVNVNPKPQIDEQVSSKYSDGGYTNNYLYKMVSPSVVGIVSKNNEGSGIVLSEEGYIITNAHVVEGSMGGLQVAIPNGDDMEYFDAKLIGSDRQTDIAVIKVDNAKLKPAEFGRSSDLEIGERIIAIGNPGGVQFASSLSVGWVSGLNRVLSDKNLGFSLSVIQLEIGERIIAIGNPGGVQFASSLSVGWVSGLNRVLSDKNLGFSLSVIQVNAAINPGNSGGALINRFGQVVGINSSKISATDYEGMGFAIPIDDAMPIVEDLIKNGKVTGRAMLGIMAVEIDAFTARFNGLPRGIQVREATENESLAEAGIMPGDIIVGIAGKEVGTMGEVASALKKQKPGDRVEVEVYRPSAHTFNDGNTFKATITLVGS